MKCAIKQSLEMNRARLKYQSPTKEILKMIVTSFYDLIITYHCYNDKRKEGNIPK